jgi:F-type H+-transporting ATPase subunit b
LKVKSRFSSPVFRFALLAVLVAGLASVSFRASAQEPAPASAPVATTAAQAPAAQGTAAPDAAKTKEAPKTEQEELDVYRHAPIVRSAARLLHMDLEVTAKLFEFINFAIIALAVLIPLSRFLPKVIRKRSQTVRHDIDSARKMTEDANARLSAIEAKLSGLDHEIAGIRSQVEQESKQDEARIKATIGEESARIVAAAEQEIDQAAAQATRGLRHFAADLAIEQAAKQLVLAPETDRALIAEFLTGVAGDGAHQTEHRGGQN